MLRTLKAKIYVFFALLAAGVSVYIKILRSSVKRKNKEINTLKQNEKTQQRVHKNDIKREKFGASQKAKADILRDESKLNEINEKRGKISESDNFTTIDR